MSADALAAPSDAAPPADSLNSSPPAVPSSSAPPALSSTPSPEVPLSAGPFGSAPESPLAPAAPVAGQPPVTPAITPAATPPLDPFVQQLRDMGFADLNDPQAAQSRVIEALRVQQQRLQAETQQRQEYEAQARAYAQLQHDPRWQAFQQQQVAPQTPQQHPWWNPPDFKPDLLTEYRVPEVGPDGKPTGKEVWKPETPAEYKLAADQWVRHNKQWQEDLLTRPHEILPKIIEHEVLPLVERMWQQREERAQMRSFAEQLNAQNQDWLYAKDPQTNGVLQDPHTGNPVLSADGDAVYRYIEAGKQLGITQPQALWQYATQMHRADLLAYQARTHQAAQGAAATNNQLKLNHLQAAATTVPSRGGSLPVPGQVNPVSQNPKLSAGQQLAQAFREQGMEVFAPSFS